MILLIVLLSVLVFSLLIALGICIFYLYRFANIIMTFEDDLSDAIENFNNCEKTFDKILGMKLFFDSPDIRPILMDVMTEIKACKISTFEIVQKFTQRSKQKYIRVEQEEEDEG